MNATPKRRLIHSITVGPRSAKVYKAGEAFQVAYLWEGSQWDSLPWETREKALRSARKYVWQDNEPMRERLNAFAQEHGRAWKSDLTYWWSSGKDAGYPLLRKARNELGPEWLKKITTDDLEA